MSSGSRTVSPSAARERVLYVTSEMADFVKVGGLGEVSAALPRALREHADVRVLIPGYPTVRRNGGEIVARLPGQAAIPPCEIARLQTADGLTIYAVICPELFDRPGSPYTDATGRDWSDNDLRFARLALAAADMTTALGDPGWRPQVLHLNDWPTALAPAYLAWRGSTIPTLLTIHNLAYQGLFERERLSALGIPEQAFHVEGVEFYGKLSFLKAGAFYATQLTTVSSTYAAEITQPEFGCGLDGLLRARARQGRLTGILNGIDAGFDPRTDPHLLCHFDGSDWSGKTANAAHIRQRFGLAVSHGPLFAIVSRLVHQKGIDLAIEVAEAIVRDGGQIVATGRGEPAFETAMQALADRHPDSVGVRIGFDETEARRIYAGSDFLLMPSRFEPCGLSQMYAQRFGSLPIAHRTGGLADTIRDGLTGFLFRDLSLSGLAGAIRRAFDAFGAGSRLADMRRQAMSQSFGWDRSAQAYGALYRGGS